MRNFKEIYTIGVVQTKLNFSIDVIIIINVVNVFSELMVLRAIIRMNWSSV